MSLFVDTSVWFAAVSKRDRGNAQAKAVLESDPDLVTTDHILIESWLLLNSRFGRGIAELFWEQVRGGSVQLEMVTSGDLEAAWAIGPAFPDQDFSFVDRTSFAVMERLGIGRAASFDHHFAVYRYGRGRTKAFEIVRAGHSSVFATLCEAVLARKQVALRYGGKLRLVCPHIVGHTAGAERALVFQLDGDAQSQLPPGGEWRCLVLSDVTDVELRDGPWHTKGYHRTTQRCVDKVFVDVDERVPNQPGRRLRGLLE